MVVFSSCLVNFYQNLCDCLSCIKSIFEGEDECEVYYMKNMETYMKSEEIRRRNEHLDTRPTMENKTDTDVSDFYTKFVTGMRNSAIFDL